MGCCMSTQSLHPYPNPEPSSSSRAITSPTSSPTLPRPSTTGSATQQRPPVTSRKPKPLKRHTWTSKRSKPWTRSEIDRERKEFFETRVTGRQEVWQSLHAALELLWEGGNDGLATAQALLNAAEITIPSGNLTREIYDSLGALYLIPEYVVSDPSDLRDDGGELSDGSSETTEEERRRRREDKGKGVEVLEGDGWRVKVRLSDGRPDVFVRLGSGETIRALKMRILIDNRLPPDTNIKIIYMGRHLKENSSLTEEGWSEGDVVNAFLCGQ